MKKLIFTGAIVLLVLIVFSCDFLPAGEGNEEEIIGTTNVMYSKDGGSLTIYLDGTTVPVSKSARAVNQTIADRGLEVFEVVFMQGSDIARATWNLGDGVSIKNVPRGATAAGINYFSIDPDTVASSAGTAVVFAGRKNGTLLAVGRLTAVNDTAGFVVDANTRSVTFGLSALVGGNYLTASTSSWAVTDSLTPADPNFKRVPVNLGTNVSPSGYEGYIFRPGISTLTATYTLAASSLAFPIANMLPAIRVINDSQSPNLVKEMEPDIIGYKKIPAPYAVIKPTIDATFAATFTPATSAGVTIAFPAAALIFDFDTTTGNEIPGVISFYFEFTVCALSRVTSADGIIAKTWYIRPGYDYNYLDLGLNGTGGSVLVAVNPNINNITALDFSDGIAVKTVTTP